MRLTLITSIVAAVAVGCPYVPENPPPRCDEDVCTIEEGSNLVSVVDATDDDRWIYFDFETAGAVDASHPGWDLAFRRMVIQSNGGVNGDGGVEIAVVEDSTFTALNTTPASGWDQDQDGNPEDRDPGGTVFNANAWYAYDLFTHSLQPLEKVYVVRTVERGEFKVRVDGYYDAEGTSGWVHFTWSAIGVP